MRRQRAAAALVAALVLGGCAGSRAHGLTDWLAVSSIAVGKPAPAFSAPRVGGGTVDLARLRGHPVYVNVFASWCAPCKAETPTIVRLSRAYRAYGLVVVGVDEQEAPATARAFMQHYHIPYDVALDDGRFAQRHGLEGLPVHLFVDREGIVRLARYGIMTDDEIEKALAGIASQANER